MPQWTPRSIISYHPTRTHPIKVMNDRCWITVWELGDRNINDGYVVILSDVSLFSNGKEIRFHCTIAVFILKVAHFTTVHLMLEGRTRQVIFTVNITHNPSMVGIARGLWKSPTPNPPQGHPQQDAQDNSVQVGLEPLQKRTHNLPGQPGPGLWQPNRKLFLMFRWNFLCCPLCPLPLFYHWIESSPILLPPCFRNW